MSLENNALTPSQDATRSAILDASRELFAKYGYKKTTMEDIALVLHKGKSSLYYYFKNKEEIFQAVIEHESEILYNKLEEVVISDKGPKEKLREYVVVRMETVSKLDNYQKVLQNNSPNNYDFLENIKREGDCKEETFLQKILSEGVEEDIFQIKDTKMGATTIAIALKGLEIPLFKKETKISELNTQLENILNILFFGVLKR